MDKIKEIFKDFKRSLNWFNILIITLIINIVYCTNDDKSLHQFLIFNLVWFVLILLAYGNILLTRKHIVKTDVIESPTDKVIVNENISSLENYIKYIDSINRQIEYAKSLSSRIPELEKISKMTYEEYIEKYRK